MEENPELEELEMTLIACSGDGRSFAFQALEAAKEGNFHLAEALLRQSAASLGEAHKSQTALMQQEARDGEAQISMLLIHAQDHLMASILAQELITELVLVYQSMKEGC